MSSRALLLALAALLVPACAEEVADGDTVSTVTVRVSTAFQDAQGFGAATTPAISFDGRWVAFASDASDLTDNDSNGLADIFVKDRLTGQVENITNRSFLFLEMADCEMPAISGNGRFVAFVSVGKYVDLPGYPVNNVFKCVYVYDRQDNVFRAPFPAWPNADCLDPSLSGIGRHLTFASGATTLGLTTGGISQIVLCDFGPTFDTPVLSLVSHAEGTPAVGANDVSFFGRPSGDGSRVSFMSNATNLAAAQDAHAGLDVYLWVSGAAPPVRLVSVLGPGSAAGRLSAWPAISFDGNFVAYSHRDDADLIPRTIQRYDVAGNTTLTVSDPVLSPGSFDAVSISGDGRYVAYVAPPGGGFAQVWRFDVATGLNEQLSVTSFGVTGNQNSIHVALSGDGVWSAWESRSSNLVAGDTNGAADIFVRGPSSGF